MSHLGFQRAETRKLTHSFQSTRCPKLSVYRSCRGHPDARVTALVFGAESDIWPSGSYNCFCNSKIAKITRTYAHNQSHLSDPAKHSRNYGTILVHVLHTRFKPSLMCFPASSAAALAPCCAAFSTFFLKPFAMSANAFSTYKEHHRHNIFQYFVIFGGSRPYSKLRK